MEFVENVMMLTVKFAILKELINVSSAKKDISMTFTEFVDMNVLLDHIAIKELNVYHAQIIAANVLMLLLV
jgi:hypothetical protein